MLAFDPHFWPLFWALVLTGAAVTAALCLVVGLVPPPRQRRRPTAGAGAPDQAPESFRLTPHRKALR